MVMTDELMKNDDKTRKKLIAEFEPSTYEDWYKAAEKSLKGKPVEKLIGKSYEGIDIKPIYNNSDIEGLEHIGNEYAGFAPFVRGSRPDGYKTETWKIAQRIPYPDPAELNKALNKDLERGQNAIYFTLDEASSNGIDPLTDNEGLSFNGTSISTIEDIETALKNIDITKYSLYIEAGSAFKAFAGLFGAYLQKNNIDSNKLKGGFLSDPIAELESNASINTSLEDIYSGLADLTNWVKDKAQGLTSLAIDGGIYNNAGANAIQELAFSFAKAVLYIRRISEKGLDINDIAPRMAFKFSIGPNFFMEIAKLRAARMVWAKIVKEFGGNEEASIMAIHSETCSWNKSKADAYVNMLRTTNETLAAIIGGSESIHAGNFDESFGLPNEFSRRTSRNTQLVLQEECNLTDITDPAGGSWYIESLTDSIAKRVWDLFREIEELGGMETAIQQGYPLAKINEVCAARIKNLSTRKDILLGINKYPNQDEKEINPYSVDARKIKADRKAALESYMSERNSGNAQKALSSLASDSDIDTLIDVSAKGATLGEMFKAMYKDKTEISHKLEKFYIPGMFEDLRDKAAAYKAKNGSAPKVFLATMGPLAKHKARADFSIDFFSVGGFSAEYAKGYENNNEAIAALKDSGSKIAVICSTDDDYAEIIPSLAPEMKKAVPEVSIVLAGYPIDKLEDYKTAGVDEFIHVRANIYEIMEKLQKATGLSD